MDSREDWNSGRNQGWELEGETSVLTMKSVLGMKTLSIMIIITTIYVIHDRLTFPHNLIEGMFHIYILHKN